MTEWRVRITYGDATPSWLRGTVYDACFTTKEQALVFAAANGGEAYLAEWPEEPEPKARNRQPREQGSLL